MDRDPSTTGARWGPPLGGFLVLTAIVSVVSVVSHDVFSGDGREEFATSAAVLAAAAVTLLVGLRPAGPHRGAGASPDVSLPLAGRSLARRRLPDVFPGLAIPGMLDRRGISGGVRRAPSVPVMPMLMALAVHLVRVTVGTARERGTPARAEVAG